MIHVSCAESIAVRCKSISIDVVHRVILHKNRIIAAVVGIPNHCLYIIFGTMVVALIVPFKRAVHHITVDIDWPLSIIYLRNIDNQQRMSFVFNYINIFFDKDISVYFVAVQGIEELLF